MLFGSSSQDPAFACAARPAVVTLAIGLGLAWRRKAALGAVAGLAVAVGYLGLGVVQHGRAVAAQAAAPTAAAPAMPLPPFMMGR